MDTSQAGWYPDPSGDSSKLRYWDGIQWTESYTDTQQAVSPSQPQVLIRETTYTSASGYQASQSQVYIQPPVPLDGSTKTLRLIAFIVNLVCTIAVGWTLIPLAWMIPMTVHSWGLYKGTKRNTIGFGVCNLIFLSIIGGILLLVSGED